MSNFRARTCDLPVDLDCEVFSVQGFSDPKLFKKRAIGRFLIAQSIIATDPKKTADGRLSFRFYGQVSSGKIAARIKKQLSTRKSIFDFACAGV